MNMLRLFHPSWVVGKNLLVNGSGLLWDTARNMGQPYLADPQNQALYPLSLLAPFTSYLGYQRIFIVFHVILATISTFLLVRKLHRDDVTALFAGLAFGFNGFFLMHVTLPPQFATMAWIPAVLLAYESRKVSVLGLVLTLQWLAGYPPFFVLSFFAVAGFSLSRGPVRDGWRRLAPGLAIMLGLTAIQYLPFLEMLHESVRSVLLSKEAAFENACDPLGLSWHLVAPSFIPPPFEPAHHADRAITSYYFGPFFLALFVWGIVKGKSRERLLGGMGVVSLLLSLGPVNKIYPHIPFITFIRFPGHWNLLAVVPFTLVGAFGFHQIRKPAVRWAVFGLVALDLMIYAIPVRFNWGHPEIYSKVPRIIGLETVPANTRVFHAAAITGHAGEWEIRTRDGYFALRGLMLPSIGVASGIHEAISYDVLTNRRAADFADRLNASPPSAPIFDEAGISRIVTLSAEGTRRAFPRWSDGRVIENPDYKPHVFIDSGKPVNVVRDVPGHVSVQAEGPGMLVLSEAYYPGWGARIDGERQTLTSTMVSSRPSASRQAFMPSISAIDRPPLSGGSSFRSSRPWHWASGGSGFVEGGVPPLAWAG